MFSKVLCSLGPVELHQPLWIMSYHISRHDDVSTMHGILKKTDRLKGEAKSATGNVNVPGRSDAMLTVSTVFTLLASGSVHCYNHPEREHASRR